MPRPLEVVPFLGPVAVDLDAEARRTHYLVRPPSIYITPFEDLDVGPGAEGDP